jgi:hypothetical protein
MPVALDDNVNYDDLLGDLDDIDLLNYDNIVNTGVTIPTERPNIDTNQLPSQNSLFSDLDFGNDDFNLGDGAESLSQDMTPVNPFPTQNNNVGQNRRRRWDDAFGDDFPDLDNDFQYVLHF